MQNHRYPGTRPFSQEEKNIFFGRDEDIQKLTQLVSIESLVVLTGKSGTGRTSLINAGIIPKLEHEGIYETILIRFNTYASSSPENPIALFTNAVQKGVSEKNFIYDKLIPKDAITESKLWYHFKSKQLEQSEAKTFIIIFDQFEELFSYPENQIDEFKKILAELINVNFPQQLRNILKEKISVDKEFITKPESLLLYKPINLKIVFAIKSERLSSMIQLTDYLPNILKNCYELQPLTERQAMESIVKPAQLTDRDYTTKSFFLYEDSIEEIIRFLTKDGQQDIEALLLQMICRHVEDIAEKNKLETITPIALGDLQNISANFYSNVIDGLKEEEKMPVRIFIEDGLIFEEDQRRVSLFEGQIFKQYNISKELLKKLIDSHLLRAEAFDSGGFSYELSNDMLIAPILKSKNIRLQEENVKREIQKQQEELIRIREEEEQKRIEARKKLRTNLRIAAAIVLGIIAVIGTYSYSTVKESKAKLAIQKSLVVSLKAQSKADSLAKESLKGKAIADSIAKESIKGKAISDSIAAANEAMSLKEKARADNIDKLRFKEKSKADSIALVKQKEYQESQDALLISGGNLFWNLNQVLKENNSTMQDSARIAKISSNLYSSDFYKYAWPWQLGWSEYKYGRKLHPMKIKKSPFIISDDAYLKDSTLYEAGYNASHEKAVFKNGFNWAMAGKSLDTMKLKIVNEGDNARDTALFKSGYKAYNDMIYQKGRDAASKGKPLHPMPIRLSNYPKPPLSKNIIADPKATSLKDSVLSKKATSLIDSELYEKVAYLKDSLLYEKGYKEFKK